MAALKLDITTSASALLTICGVYWIYKRWTYPPRLPLPPGPRGLSAVLSFLSALRSFTLHQEAEKWFRKYGEIVSVNIFGQNIIFLNSSRILKKCFCDETLRRATNDRPETFAGGFVFNNENIGFSQLGPRHTKLRKLFHGSLKLYGDGVKMFEESIMGELTQVVNEIRCKSEVELDAVVSKSLLSVIHILLTDKRLDYNDITVEEMVNYNATINRLFGPDFDQPLTMMPFLRYFPGPFKTICDKTESKIKTLIQLLMDPMKEDYVRGKPNGLIQAAIEVRNDLDDSTMMNEDHVRFIMLEIISAGYLTTKGVLMGILLVFIERPALQQKVYDLVAEQIGSRAPTVDDRHAIPYVDAMVLEAARYLTHGPFSIPHRTNKDIEIDGYRIPKDSMIMANFWSLGHDEKIWEEPWEFRPERYLDDDGSLISPEHPVRQSFQAFGVGKRQCPGEVFAKTRLFLFITTLVQHFRFRPPDGGMTSFSDSRTWTPGIILQPPRVLCRVELRDTHPLIP